MGRIPRHNLDYSNHSGAGSNAVMKDAGGCLSPLSHKRVDPTFGYYL